MLALAVPVVDVVGLAVGQRVTGRLLVAEASIAKTREGVPFLRLLLRDRAGRRIVAKLWDFDGAPPRPGEVVEIEAAVVLYKGKAELRLGGLRVAGPADPADWAFEVAMPLSERRHGFEERVAAIVDRDLRLLVGLVFDEPGLLDRFLVAPAALLYHSAKVGGLAVHTLRVHDLALQSADCYGPGDLDRDVLRAGALLHDVGKADELEVSLDTGLLPAYTEAHLQGHISLGVGLLDRAADTLEISGAPRVKHVRHLVLSHHGAPEHGSPIVPMTPEAHALHAADNTASRLEGAFDLIEAAPPGAHWTDRSGMFGGPIYLRWR